MNPFSQAPPVNLAAPDADEKGLCKKIACFHRILSDLCYLKLYIVVREKS